MDERAEERRELAELERDDREDARREEYEALTWLEQVADENERWSR